MSPAEEALDIVKEMEDELRYKEEDYRDEGDEGREVKASKLSGTYDKKVKGILSALNRLDSGTDSNKYGSSAKNYLLDIKRITRQLERESALLGSIRTGKESRQKRKDDRSDRKDERTQKREDRKTEKAKEAPSKAKEVMKRAVDKTKDNLGKVEQNIKNIKNSISGSNTAKALNQRKEEIISRTKEKVLSGIKKADNFTSTAIQSNPIKQTAIDIKNGVKEAGTNVKNTVAGAVNNTNKAVAVIKQKVQKKPEPTPAVKPEVSQTTKKVINNSTPTKIVKTKEELEKERVEKERKETQRKKRRELRNVKVQTKREKEMENEDVDTEESTEFRII